MFGLMSAAQSLFITFGPWLEDDFGVRTVGLAAVTFGLGALELVGVVARRPPAPTAGARSAA